MYKIPFIPYLSAYLAKTEEAFTNLDNYMLEMIAERKASARAGEEPKADLFESLWRAAEEEEEDGGEGTAAKLGDREVLGNTFIFLL